MGLLGILSGVAEAGVSIVLSPLAVASDMLEGGNDNTAACIAGAAHGTKKAVKSTLTIVHDPFDEEDDDW